MAKVKIRPLNMELEVLHTKRRDIMGRIKFEETKPRISDHAIVRYLERVHGFSFEDTRNELLDRDAVASINLGAGKIKRDGFTMVIVDRCIVTIND